MLGLRIYKKSDAAAIASWCKDEKALRLWSSDRFGDFPVSAESINDKYIGNNGDCGEEDNFYPFTAFDENGAVGHLIMRYTGGDRSIIRFGFVILDDEKRGQGLGKEMLSLALKYAFEIYRAKKVTLGVFENNPAAYYCYKSVGFKETGERMDCEMMGETWTVAEMEVTAEEYSH